MKDAWPAMHPIGQVICFTSMAVTFYILILRLEQWACDTLCQFVLRCQ